MRSFPSISLSLAIALGAILTSLLAATGFQVFQSSQAQTLPPAEPELTMPTDSVDPELIAANHRLGFNLLEQLLQDAPGENVLISPTSVAMALAMAYNGAEGDTQQAMAEALEIQGLSLEALNQANGALKEALASDDPAVTLAMANSLWARQNVEFKADFLARNRQFYGAEIASLDFGNPKTLNVINAWVNDQTKGKIPGILDQISPEQVMFLINALYFKGDWQTPFDPDQTTDKPFYQADGAEKQLPMMARSDSFQYLETDQVQAVSLPYGEGRWAMDIWLPKSDVGFEAFAKEWTAEQWQQSLNQFRSREGSLELPRFQVDYEASLSSALSALGMGQAFTDEANFAGMSDLDLLIDEVRHKTVLEVNEEGSEAAAATSVGISVTSIQIPQDPFEMVVDRPFMVTIRDRETGTLLFMGAIVDPQ
ncbi:serpin family protein [Synechococcales cyanobacterium C]|uniref:Serpin family protein n=1 Tax=Petrachloros mirabilis ULC683 TaxID=2781853 RepID=A0A8K1ZYB5_9CYAN|nr:serpin family protein [Petrachloros mirabilis ULC683]